MILHCSCTHPYQDSLYGAGNRVFNQMHDPAKARCTVCGRIGATNEPAKKAQVKVIVEERPKGKPKPKKLNWERQNER